MPTTGYTTAVAALTGILGHWDMGTSPMPAFTGSLDMVPGTDPGTFGQPSIVVGDPTNLSVVRANGANERVSNIGVVADTAALDVTSVSLGAWCRCDRVYGDNAIFTRGGKYALSLQTTTYGTPRAGLTNNVGGVDLTAGAPDWIIAPGQPFFLVGTKGASFQRLYVNGVLANETALSGSIVAGTEAFQLGAATFTGPVNGWIGAIQHPFLASSEMTTAQVRQLYEIGSATAAEVAGQSIQAMPWSRDAFASDTNRKYAVLTNGSDAPVWVRKATGAVVGGGRLLQPFGGTTRIDDYTGIISVITSAYTGGKTVGLESG
jgi:hypothetical protein